jgi:hypothetical protein
MNIMSRGKSSRVAFQVDSHQAAATSHLSRTYNEPTPKVCFEYFGYL